jgi:3-(3-hydroxy-phenyl)propionate hydroxylase
LSDAKRAAMQRAAIRMFTIDGAAGDPSSLQDVDGDLTRWFAAHQAAAVLLRPDFYVYGIAHDAPDLRRLIGRLCGTLFA